MDGLPLSLLNPVPMPRQQPVETSPPHGASFVDRLEPPGAIDALMHDAERGFDRIDGVINAALSGRHFSNHELLAMQAMVQKYSLELDLLSKLVQSASQGLRDVLKTQV